VIRVQSIFAALLCAALAALAPVRALADEPTEFEQYMIELLNRARVDPEGEVNRLGTGSLNEGPPTLGGFPYTIPPGPKQPLAVSTTIMDAAIDYAQLLNDTDTFCHGCFGTSSTDRMWMAGYVPFLNDFDFFDIAGYTLAYGGAQDPGCSSGCAIWVPGRENLSFRAEWPSNGMIDDLIGAIDQAHTGLFNDFTVPSRGHRSTMLYGEWKEVGIGIVEGQDDGGSSDSVYIVQNFAHRSDTGPFLTGVAYDDVDADGFYTPNGSEALGGIAVNVYYTGTSTLAGSTTTLDAGGYSVELGIGLYDVIASGSGWSQSYWDVPILASGPGGIGENRKLDVIPVPEPSGPLGMAAGICFLALLHRVRRR